MRTEIRDLTPGEVEDARTHLRAKKGKPLLGRPFSFAQPVQYAGKTWLVYDHESRTTLILISKNLAQIATDVPEGDVVASTGKTLTTASRGSLIRLAATLPHGSRERTALLRKLSADNDGRKLYNQASALVDSIKKQKKLSEEGLMDLNAILVELQEEFENLSTRS